MKIFISLLLLLQGLFSFSQQPVIDSLQELNELKTLRDQLKERLSRLESDLLISGSLLDSCLKKLEMLKAESNAVKPATKKIRKDLERSKNDILKLEKQLEEIADNRTKTREMLEQVHILMKELDNQIRLLSKVVDENLPVQHE